MEVLFASWEHQLKSEKEPPYNAFPYKQVDKKGDGRGSEFNKGSLWKINGPICFRWVLGNLAPPSLKGDLIPFLIWNVWRTSEEVSG